MKTAVIVEGDMPVFSGKKPLWRWTMYDAPAAGFEVFAEAVARTTAAYGDAFDYAVLYNGADAAKYRAACAVALRHGARILPQKITDMPVPCRGPSLWKVCPPRLAPDAHEVVCDNDLVFLRPLPKIREFLRGTRPLLLADPVRFFGGLDRLHAAGARFNSGLMGLPPGYDFGGAIRAAWAAAGRPAALGYGEEQALLTYCLGRENPVVVGEGEVVELFGGGLAGGRPYTPGRECGLHFVTVNRETHGEWEKYKRRRRA